MTNSNFSPAVHINPQYNDVLVLLAQPWKGWASFGHFYSSKCSFKNFTSDDDTLTLHVRSDYYGAIKHMTLVREGFYYKFESGLLSEAIAYLNENHAGECIQLFTAAME